MGQLALTPEGDSDSQKKHVDEQVDMHLVFLRHHKKWKAQEPQCLCRLEMPHACLHPGEPSSAQVLPSVVGALAVQRFGLCGCFGAPLELES